MNPLKPLKLLDLLELTPLDSIAMPPLEVPAPVTSDLFGPGTASTAPAQAPDLATMRASLDKLMEQMSLQAGPLRKLFAEHGYDLEGGDVLYHGPELVIEVPERYRAQVKPHAMLEGRAMWFTRNPRFSLF